MLIVFTSRRMWSRSNCQLSTEDDGGVCKRQKWKNEKLPKYLT